MELLKKGSKGMSVITLQTYLKNVGYNLIIDGIFGEITEECVKDYQKKNKLVSDGIVGDKTWNSILGSKPTTQTKRKITEVYLHCSATIEGKEYTTADIKRWHLDRGFSDIGYHYVIYLDGSIHKGREESQIGAHVSGYNSKSIGICYIGGLDKNKKSKDTRTIEQKEALFRLVHDIIIKYNLTLENVHGHYERAPKTCPCFKIENFRKEYKEYFSK